MIGAGIAICIGDEINLVGDTPSRPEVDTIRRWLDANQQENVFHTEQVLRALSE